MILFLIRPNLQHCRITIEQLSYVREIMSSARIITEDEYNQIDAGTLVPSLELGYSVMLDEAPITVVIEEPTPTPTPTPTPETENETVLAEVESILNLNEKTKTELFNLLVVLDPATSLTSANLKAELITAIEAFDRPAIAVAVESLIL